MKLYLKILSALLCFLCTTFCIAQENPYQNEPTLLKNYSEKDGMPQSVITAIAQDKIGYIWFATNGGGLARFDGTTFKTYTQKNGLASNKISALTIKNDSLFIGNDYGLSIKIYDQFYNFESKKITKILTVNNIVFVGNQQGIFQLKKEYLAPLKINFQIDLLNINDILFDGKSYWIATKKALWKVDDLQHPKLIKKIDEDEYCTLLFSDKTIIGATVNNGIKHIANDIAILKYKTPKRVHTLQKIGSEFWVCTANDGIDILNRKLEFIRKINKYNNALKTNAIETVFKDVQNNIWVATTHKGIFQFKDNKTPLKEQKPIISLENIAINYEVLDSLNINHYEKTLALPPEKNNISFSFKTVDINHPKALKYRWSLDEKYSPWSTKNSIDFANLKAGKYRFTVQSKNNDELKSEVKKFHFFIDKPIYQKAWFIWACIGSVGFLITLLILSYVQRLKRRNKAKVAQLKLENHLLSLEQKALQLQMNPHFIFNVLNGIKALGNAGKPKELNTTISQFAVLLRSVLNNSRLEEISVQQEIETLENYLALEQKMNAKPFEYYIKTELNGIDAEEILIPPMLLQPFIENSIKHGFPLLKNKGELTILFEVKKDFLHCTVLDNGIGIEHSKQLKKDTQAHQSVALKVSKERIENLSDNTSFLIEEIKENNTVKGSKVWFKIPLKTDF